MVTIMLSQIIQNTVEYRCLVAITPNIVQPNPPAPFAVRGKRKREPSIISELKLILLQWSHDGVLVWYVAF